MGYQGKTSHAGGKQAEDTGPVDDDDLRLMPGARAGLGTTSGSFRSLLRLVFPRS